MMRLKKWVRKCKIVYNFNLSNLSTYRQEMMGLSIAMVFFNSGTIYIGIIYWFGFIFVYFKLLFTIGHRILVRDNSRKLFINNVLYIS